MPARESPGAVRTRTTYLGVIGLLVLSAVLLSLWSGLQSAGASAPEQAATPTPGGKPLVKGVLGMLRSIEGRGGGGGSSLCDLSAPLSDEPYWLFSGSIGKFGGSLAPHRYDTPYYEIVAERCGEPPGGPIRFTLHGPDGVMFQGATDEPLDPFENAFGATVAPDYFRYSIMDWNVADLAEFTLFIDGDSRPVQHIFVTPLIARIFVGDEQTGASQQTYEAGERLHLRAAGFSLSLSLDLVLYRAQPPLMIPVQSSRIETDDYGNYTGVYPLPKDLPPGRYVLVTCAADGCSITLDELSGLEFNGMAAAFFDVASPYVFVDPAIGFTGVRLIDLGSGDVLTRTDPGERLIVLGTEEGERNGRTYIRASTLGGSAGWVLKRYLITLPVEETYFDLAWCEQAPDQVQLRLMGEDTCTTYFQPDTLEEWTAQLQRIIDGEEQIALLAEDETLAAGAVSGSNVQFAILDEDGTQRGWINIGVDVPHEEGPSPVGAVWRTDLNSNLVEPICWIRTDFTWRCETAEGVTPWIE